MLGCMGMALVPNVYGQSDVRVGVLGLFHAKEFVLEPVGRLAVSIQGRGTGFVLNGENGKRNSVFRAQGNTILAESFSSPTWRVTGRDGAAVRFRLSVPGKIHRIYEGRLELEAHQGELTAIVTMNRELAVASIVEAEMPRDALPEALKAQAVVARSFLAAGRRHGSFDFCDTTHCQFLRSPDDINKGAHYAVQATEGLVLSYQGRTLAAMYSSRCGGQTRSLSEVGMHVDSGYPYYAVSCRWCREHPVHWQTRLDAEDGRPEPGNEGQRLQHARLWGWSALPGSAFQVKEDASGLLIEGRSVGHGLGLCQFGAMGMASAGSDFRTILAYYYPNSEIRPLR